MHPPTPPRESRVANARSYLRARVRTLARPWSRASHGQARPPLHPGAVSPSWAPVHTATACTASGRPAPALPRSSPGPPSGSARPSSSSLASAPGRWPQPREPWGRAQEQDLSDRGTPTGCQLWSLQLDEPQRPRRRRTRNGTDGRTDALTAQLALPPRSSLCASR